MTTAPATSTFGDPAVTVGGAEQDDVRFWSVTTIIGTLDKPALVHWSAQMTARKAIRLAGTLPGLIEAQGEQQVERDLARARFERPRGERSAAELGTAVHDACEQYALTGERPEVDDEVRPFIDRFEEWCQVWQPQYEAAEVTVYNPTYGYAGTADMFVTLDGMRLIGDYKTSKTSTDSRSKERGPYSTVALQLAAYRYAEMAAAWRPRRHEQQGRRYYLLGPDERDLAVPVPEVDGGVAIHISPDHCTAYPVRCDEQVFTAFLYVQEAARWAMERSKTVIGNPLVRGAM